MIKSLKNIATAAVLLCATSVLAKDDVKEYGIVVLPEEACVIRAASINAKIASMLPGLENPQNNWHVTLYQGAYKSADLPEITKLLHEIKLKPMNLIFNSIYDTSNRWLDFGMESTEDLQKLHGEVVRTFSKYHVRPLDRIRDVYDTLPSEERKQVSKYGVYGVMESYNPHMTLFYTYPADIALRNVSKDERNLTDSGMICKASSIALGELGYNGNIIKIIDKVEVE